MTAGVHTNTIPLGSGLIMHYLKNSVSQKLDFKIFKDPIRFKSVLKEWKPDVLGIAQYSWNSELNLYMAQLAKKFSPDCLIIAGGPNLHLSSKGKFTYLKQYSFIDVCVSYDGEIPFAETVKRLIDGEKIKDIRRSPVAGAYSIDTERGALIESKELPPRLTSLDVFGSMYADGFFDELLNEGFHPFLQTQRGCPFRCTYCHTGDDYYSRIIFQSPEYFRRDMEYLGKRFLGKHNVTLYMANTNFSLYKEDIEIAKIIREIQDKYDWPKSIDINSGNNPDKLLEVLSMLKYKFIPGAAMQTLTPKVLKNISRKNMSFDKFITFQKYVSQNISRNTATELILNLPGETKKSFLDTVAKVLNSGVQNIVIYSLMALRGTKIASTETVKRYGHLLQHRIVPRCFSEIDGVRIFDTEEIVVGTNGMPFKDYLDLRGLSLIVTTFASSTEMFPIRKFLMENNLDVACWISGIQNRIRDFSSLYSIYKFFLSETERELFPTRNALIEFFSKPKNYNLLFEGKLGDNLLRKYKAIFLSKNYEICLKIALFELRNLAGQRFDPSLLNTIVDDFESFLKTRDVGHIFEKSYGKARQQEVVLHYDIPKWLACQAKEKSLLKHKGICSYSVVVTDYMYKRLADFKKINRQPQLSSHILYRDGHIQDFWPLWSQKDKIRSADNELQYK